MKPEMGTRRGGSARGLVMVTQHLGKGGWGQWGRVAAGTVTPSHNACCGQWGAGGSWGAAPHGPLCQGRR